MRYGDRGPQVRELQQRVIAAGVCAAWAALAKELGYLLVLTLPVWTWAWEGRLPARRAWVGVLGGLFLAGALRAQVTLQAMLPQALPGDPLREVLGDALAWSLGWLAWP